MHLYDVMQIGCFKFPVVHFICKSTALCVCVCVCAGFYFGGGGGGGRLSYPTPLELIVQILVS